MDTIGTPMKFSCCVAENEAKTPWDPWRVQQGFALDDTTVTVNVPYGMTEFFDFKNSDPELLVETLGHADVASRAAPRPPVPWLIKTNAPLEAGYPFHGVFSNLLLMAPDHANVSPTRAGRPRTSSRRSIAATKLQFRQLMLNQEYDSFRTAHPELLWLLDVPRDDGDCQPVAGLLRVLRGRRFRGAQPVLLRRHQLGDKARRAA